MSTERTPGMKLLLAGLVGLALVLPLMMVYGLVSDRQHQARIAQHSIAAGWAGPQVISGPLIILPYTKERVSTEIVNGTAVNRTTIERDYLYLSAEEQAIETQIDPDIKQRAIYRSVIYSAGVSGKARFAIPDDLTRLGVERDQLLLDEAVIRLAMTDPRGLDTDARLTVDGEVLPLDPGSGASGRARPGVHANLDWTGGEEMSVEFAYTLRGSQSFGVLPAGKETRWTATSSWAHPSFTGSFLPDDGDVERSDEGFTASWSISNLALGQSAITKAVPPPPSPHADMTDYRVEAAAVEAMDQAGAHSPASIRLIEPVDLYSQVDRAVKYGFLFIGFTFLAFLMFDVVGGARVAAAEYLLTGAGLVLFFVMLLAFAEMIGFAWSYLVASVAIIGLLTAYSAAVLGSWMRARVIGALLAALYAVLYVLLNLEAWSLVIGSVLLFLALAGMMYATRNIDWSSVRASHTDEDEAEVAATRA